MHEMAADAAVASQQGAHATMRNVFIGFLIVAAIVVGGGFIAQAAYQAGLSTAITTAVANAPDGSVVTPVAPGAYPYGYGYGYGHGPGWGYGFSIFGFLGALLFIFLIIGLLRAVFWRGPGWGGRWGGGPGNWGDRDHRGRFQETFEDWHRQAHGQPGASSGSGTPGTFGGPSESTQPKDPSA
jgi:hypothetical protein